MIGNSNYGAPELRLGNAGRDAELMAKRLAAIGFEVQSYYDLSYEDFRALQSQLDGMVRDSEIGLVYYAGHAVQIAGASYLVPVDIDVLDIADLERKKLPLHDFLLHGAAGDKGLRLFIIDACRTDPFSRLGGGIGAGLDAETASAIEPEGDVETLIAYSASSGQVASDGPPGGHSPFALALDRLLQEPGLEVTQVTRRVVRQVSDATDSQQIPWVAGNWRGEYWLNDQALLRPPETPEPGLDEVLWWFLASASEPVALERFRLFFGNSAFADAAAERLAMLRSLPPAPAPPVVEAAPPLAEVGAPIPADLFRVERDTLGAVPGGLAGIATDCDWLAADFPDLQRVTPGVRAGLIQLEAAAQACAYALKANPDNPRAAFQLGRVLDVAGLYVWARHFYLRAARQGYAAALTNLGYLYTEGLGVEADPVLAHRYYLEAATLGNLRAKTNIGEQFLLGQGVPQDAAEALVWYRLASDAGWVNAQNALADRYARGQGIARDDETAAALYELAALNGQRAAMNNLGRLLVAGRGVEQDRVAGRRWLERGTIAGDRFAPFSLARDLIETGDAAKDPGRVIDLLRLSWRRGNDRALLDLAWLYDVGKVVPRDPAAAYKAAYRAGQEGLDKAPDLARKLEDEIGPARAADLRAEADRERRLNGR